MTAEEIETSDDALSDLANTLALAGAAGVLRTLSRIGIKGLRAKKILDKVEVVKRKQLAAPKAVKRVIDIKETPKALLENSSKQLQLRNGQLALPPATKRLPPPTFHSDGFITNSGQGMFKTGGRNKYKVGEVVDLTPNEIADLLAKGFDFEIE